MADPTATPRGDPPESEQVADVTITPAQQICYWAMAHRLDACRGCTGFRIEELGLADIIASPHSGRARRLGRGDGSRLRFATA